MRAFFIGLQFLTRLSPVKQDNWTLEDFGNSVKHFPLIGVVLGVIYAGFAAICFYVLPSVGIALPVHVTSVVLLILAPLMTGGLHCDGFMDTMDGVFSGRGRDRMLEIMKDSCVGANGVFTFVVLMLLEWGILLDLVAMPRALVEATFCMPVIARIMMVLAISMYPYARPEGMGKAFAELSNHGMLRKLALLYMGLLTAAFGVLAGASILVCVAFTLFFAGYVTKRLGGLTGDVYGAITTLCEGLVLLTYLVGSSIL